MKILEELITNQTNILNLSDKYIPENKKNSIIDIMPNLARKYYSKMYYKNGIWYYFKKDIEYGFYPFTISEELIGTYLANILDLETVKYEIAKTKNNYGIASQNFKTNENNYYTFYDLVDIEINDNIDILKLLITKENYQILLNQMVKLLALDTYMLQQDRCNINLQFKQNIKTKELQFAPIYDYANCNSNVKDIYITKNVLFNVTEKNINELVERYPKYKEYISILLSHSLKQIWEQICIDYKLNMDCFTYDRVKDYYELKEENQKRYLKKIIKDIHL